MLATILSSPRRLATAAMGRALPGFRPFSRWAHDYAQILKASPLSDKSIANRLGLVKHLVKAMGDQPMRTIEPLTIARAIREIWDRGDHTTARLVLREARCMFSEAILARWVLTNPADAVRALPVKVQRKRMSLNDWLQMHDRALRHGQPWISRMLVLALVSGQRRADLQKMGPTDVWDDHLHVQQQKTGMRIALPLALRLDAIDMSLRDALAQCEAYAPAGPTYLRRSDGAPLSLASLSSRFHDVREAACGPWDGPGRPPSLHECRSLSERLYRQQGVDTMTLLGHRRQRMTDQYNNDRGLSSHEWRRLTL